MRTLILDQYSSQSPTIRWVGNSLTGLGWAFWLFLWLPLLAAIALLLELNPGQQSTNNASNTILDLLATLQAHFTTVLTMISVFLSWALVQALGKSKRRSSLQNAQNAFQSPVISFEINPDHLQDLRSSRSVVVSHGSNGVINNVDVLDLLQIADFSPEPFSQAA